MTARPKARRSPTGIAAVLALVCVLPSAAATLTLSVNGSDGKPLTDAVVAVHVDGARAVAAPGTTAQIAQRERQFQPPLTVIQTGTAVSFPNFDTVRHHVYSFSPDHRFEIKLYAGVPSQPRVFDRPGVATLGCNIHDRMSAWVVVVDTPVFALTDGSGQAVLSLPAGRHVLRAWHAGLGETGAWLEQPLVLTDADAQLTVAMPP